MTIQFIERSLSHGDRVAVRQGDTTCRYTELAASAQNVAQFLLLVENGDLQSTRVAFSLPPSAAYVAVLFGIWKAGGIAVPLSQSATTNELDYVLQDSQSAIVITTTVANGVDATSKFANLCSQSNNIRLVLFEDIVMKPTHRHRDDDMDELPDLESHRPALILYTSGTTASPKGVVLTHANLEAQITTLVHAWKWQADDRIPLFLPLHHIHGIVNILLCALYSGAQVEVFAKFDTKTILVDRVAHHAYTVFMAVPTIYTKMIDFLQASTENDSDKNTCMRDAIGWGFGQMRLMVSGSAALPASVHIEWSRLTRGQQILERYGMTEIGMALSNPYDHGERRPGAVGVPLPGVQVRLQTQNGTVIGMEQQDEEKVPGEIQVRGPNVFAHYWNKPEETRKSFTEDGGWFRTGDIGIVEDGYYRIMGRSSVDIIKSGGYKLSALEIEAVLLDHPSISQCAVVGLPNDTWGEIVGAAVVISSISTTGLDLESLKSWCKDRMSNYKMPRRLSVVKALPRNAMGKVQKPAVKQLFASL